MSNKQVGIFSGEVSDPYPCWCIIKVGNTELKFSHTELDDLDYLVKSMKRQAREMISETNIES